MKRFLSTIILLFISLSAFSMSWSVTAGEFVHDSAAYGLKAETAVSADIESWRVGAMLSDYSGALDMSYNHESSETLRWTAGTSLNGYYREGGLWTIYGDIGQDFRFWDRMALRYRAGLQAGLSWSHFSPMSTPFSLSPYCYWAIGYDDDTFKALLYGHSMREFEHTFQAPPVLGLELGWNITDEHSVGIDSYMKLADYMNGPDLMITDMAIRVFYTYRGGRA